MARGVICFCVLLVCQLALLFAVVVALHLLIAFCRKGNTPSGPTGVQHVLQGGCPLLPNHPPGICGTLVSEGALHIPKQTRPEGALHADTFNELQPATASELVGTGVFFQKLCVLDHKGRVGCVLRGHQEVVGYPGLRPRVHVLATSASKRIAENVKCKDSDRTPAYSTPQRLACRCLMRFFTVVVCQRKRIMVVFWR